MNMMQQYYYKPVVLINAYPLCRSVDTLSYIILSVGLVSAFLLILTISAVINARATHKLCWATVGHLIPDQSCINVFQKEDGCSSAELKDLLNPPQPILKPGVAESSVVLQTLAASEAAGAGDREVTM